METKTVYHPTRKPAIVTTSHGKHSFGEGGIAVLPVDVANHILSVPYFRDNQPDEEEREKINAALSSMSAAKTADKNAAPVELRTIFHPLRKPLTVTTSKGKLQFGAMGVGNFPVDVVNHLLSIPYFRDAQPNEGQRKELEAAVEKKKAEAQIQHDKAVAAGIINEDGSIRISGSVKKQRPEEPVHTPEEKEFMALVAKIPEAQRADALEAAGVTAMDAKMKALDEGKNEDDASAAGDAAYKERIRFLVEQIELNAKAQDGTGSKKEEADAAIDYSQLKVPQLIALLEKKHVTPPAGARKDELIALLTKEEPELQS